MRDHVYPLDVLRFFAAFCVAAYHLGFYSWASHYSTTSVVLNNAADYEALAPFTWFGWVGVEIFFVISGFVIANSAHGRTAAAFLKGRVIRLLPAAWVCASITLIAWLVFAHTPLQELIAPYVRSLLLWLDGPWIDGVYWSLATEIVFYAIVFWTLVASRFVSLSMIPWLLTLLAVIYITLTRMDAGADSALFGWIMANADVLMLRYGCFFACGIWLWFMSQGQMTPLRYGGLLIAVVCGYGEIAKRVIEISSGEVDIVMAMPVWAPLLVWTAAFLFVFVAARRPDLFSVRSPRLQAVFKRIGLMTYPLFLVHNVVGAGIIRALTTSGVNEWAALAIAFAVVLALANLISTFAEPSIRALVRDAFDWGHARTRLLFASKSTAL